jgi:DNA-binding MarR family transcriptional regulator/RimJ/RimL family protein N-acetyltransferase
MDPPISVPTIAGSGLRLRPWVLADAASLMSACGDPDICRFTTVPHDYTQESAAAWIRRQLQRTAGGAGIVLAIEPASVNRPVGMVGLFGLDEPGAAARFGYWIMGEHRGTGLASKAVRLVADWGFSLAVTTEAVGNVGYGLVMARADDGPESEVSLVYVIGRLNHGIRREMRQLLAEWKLSVPEFTAMSILRRRPGLSNAQLARRTMVTPQSMIEILAGLESRELVHRSVDPNHGRILKSELTEEGERLLQAAQVAVDDVQDELLEGVSVESRAVVMDAMLQAMQRLAPGHDSVRS